MPRRPSPPLLRPTRLRALGGDARGLAIIEFAFVAAPFIALLIAILQTSLIYFAQEGLLTTAQYGARLILSGQAQQAGMTSAQYKNAVCTKLPSYLSCSSLMIDVRKATSFSGINTTAPTITYDSSGNPTNTWSYDMGGTGQIVILRLMYIWPMATGPMGLNLANSGGGNRLLVATTVSKTEPY